MLMPCRKKKTSITLTEKRTGQLRDVARRADISRSEVAERAIEQMMEMIEAAKAPRSMTPWTQLFREQYKRARKRT